MATIKQSLYRFGALAAVVGVALSPVVASAAVDTKNTTINAVVGSSISMTTSGTVNLNVTPTATGSMTSASDTVTVATNNATGYNLQLSTADGTNTLVNGGNTIVADAGTQASPTSTLTNNSWGYRVDGLGGFGAGPTTAENNVASSSRSWAGVPTSSAPNTLKTTATTTASDVTTVWYGVKVDTSKPNGTYSDIVTYTATTN